MPAAGAPSHAPLLLQKPTNRSQSKLKTLLIAKQKERGNKKVALPSEGSEKRVINTHPSSAASGS